MKKSLLLILITSFLLTNTGLVQATEATQDAGLTTSQPAVSDSVKAESVKDQPVAEAPSVISAPSGSSGSGTVEPPTEEEEVILEEALDDFSREGEDGSYQQEKSADNSYKKEKGLTGDLRIDQFSGAAIYAYSLSIPSGRNGVEPSLHLYYNSHDKSFDSPFGLSWSLNLGYIVRNTKKGTNNLYTSNEYTLFLNGQSSDIVLIDEVNNLYGAKLESAFLKIQKDDLNNQWIVTDKLGSQYYLGQTENSRQDNVDHTLTYKWLLNRVEDTNQNYYRLDYFHDQNQVYPSNIYYTGHEFTDGSFQISFNLENRQDIHTSYAPTFSVITQKRLNNIEVRTNNELTTKYQLSYTTGQNGQTSLLSSITKKGYLDQVEHSLPATTFSYQTKSPGWTDDTANWPGISYFAASYFSNSFSESINDLNGDSWVDRTSQGLHNGTGWDEDWILPDLQYCSDATECGSLGDVNGDKYPDLITSSFTGLNYHYTGKVFLNNKINGFFFSDYWTDILPDFIKNSDHAISPSAYSLTDINGDELDDIIYAFRATGGGIGWGDQQRHVFLNNGHGFDEVDWNFPTHLGNCNRDLLSSCQSQGSNMIDVNNDGLVDVFASQGYVHDDFNVTPGIYYNTGNGWTDEPDQNWELPVLPNPYENAWRIGGARLSDINSDGLLDIIIGQASYYNGDNGFNFYNYSSVYLNTGSGWQEYDGWQVPLIMARFGNDVTSPDTGVRLIDINNDGAIDTVKSYCGGFVLNNGVCTIPLSIQVYLGINIVSDLLSTINNGYGAISTLEYQASGRYFDEQNNFKNPDLPMNLQTVKSITTTDGNDGSITTDYDYGSGYYYRDNNDYSLNQFTGFGIVTSKTEDQVIKTFYHQGGGVDGYEIGEYDDDIAKSGRVYREEVYKEENGVLNLLSYNISTWKKEDLGSNRTYAYLESSKAYEVNNLGRGIASEEYFDFRPEVDEEYNAYIQQLNQKQVTIFENEPQLIEESADGWQKTYYLNQDPETEKHIYQMEVYSGSSDYLREIDDNETGENNFINNPTNADGELSYETFWIEPNHTWDEVVNAEVANHINTVEAYASLAYLRQGPYQGWEATRIFLPFNTSDLPSDITITNANLSLYKQQSNISLNGYIVSTSQNSPSLNNYDYGGIGDVVGGVIGLNSEGRNNVDLNETGKNWINDNGWTNLGLRTDKDLYNISPLESRGVTIYLSENYDSVFRPILSVEYYYNSLNPGPPTDLQTEGQSNPDDVANQSPSFSAIYNDENPEDLAVGYQLQLIEVGGSFDSPLWESGYQDLTNPIVVGSRSEEISYNGNPLPLEGYQYFWRIKFWDNGTDHTEGLWSDGTDYFYMDGSAVPASPISLKTNDRINPHYLITQNPVFSAVYTDPNPIDLAKWYQLQVDNDTDFSSPVWDSQKTLLNTLLDNGLRSEDIVYGGTPLPYDGTVYYWRIKFFDDEEPNGTEGAWSSSATFSMFDEANMLTDVKVKAVEYEYDLTNGNLLEERNLGQVTAANNGIYFDITGDEKTSSYQYADPVNPESNIISAPKKKVLINPNSQEQSETELYYDNLSYGQVQSANVTKEDLIIGQTEYEKDFNQYGLVTAQRDPLNHQTTVSYDQYNLYPIETSNHLNQTTLTVYDLKTGQLLSSTDPNGLIEQRDYDAFGRLTEVRRTNPTYTNQLLTLETYEYHDTNQPSWVKQSVRIDENNWKNVYTYFDGLGRVIQTKEAISDSESVKPNLRVEYDFEEGEGNIIYDLSPNQNNGSLTYYRFDHHEWMDGYEGDYSLFLGGSPSMGGGSNYADYITLPNDDSLNNFSNTISLEIALYREDADREMRIITKGEQKADLVITENNRLMFLLNFDDHFRYITSPETVPLNQWFTAKAVYDGEKMKLYINDNLSVEDTVLVNHYLVLGTDSFRIGGGPDGSLSGSPYNGRIDSFRISEGDIVNIVRTDYKTTSYLYDQKGNLEKQTLPYLSNSSGYQAPTWNLATQPFTSYTYDSQNRVTEETFQSSTVNWTTSYNYNSWNVTITDAEGHQKKLYKDAYGQLVQVDEYLDGQVYSTFYEYNLLGKLVKITDALSNERNFYYDSLGRLTSQEEMHTPDSQNFGIWSYQYDDASNLISRTDPKGQITTFTYDSLNRILTEDYTAKAGLEVSYIYDQGDYATGRLTNVVFGQDQNSQREYQYDIWGRSSSELSSLNGEEFKMEFVYNLQSQPEKISYLAPEEYYVAYEYNPLGEATALKVSSDGVNYQYLIDNVTYSPLGQIKSIEYTNGTVTENTFDPLFAYRLTHKETIDNQAELTQDLSYAYDSIGNIIELTDSSDTILAKTTTYSYDDLSRLTEATVTGSANNQDYTERYEYDIIGNILLKSDIGEYAYQNSNPYQASEIGGSIYLYDDNGNLTNDSLQDYGYNYNDRLKTVTNTQTGLVSSFDYDQSGQRFYKETIDEPNEIISQSYYHNQYLEIGKTNYELDSITKNIFFGNQRVGQIKNDGAENDVSLLFTDHLGSSSLVTDDEGSITAIYDYYPYGGARIEEEYGQESNYRFTGHELDEETNLTYAEQRYYGQGIGRFNRIDPVSLAIHDDIKIKELTQREVGNILADPQLLNNYSYSRNNPVIYTDPTGNQAQVILAIPVAGIVITVAMFSSAIILTYELVPGVVESFSQVIENAFDAVKYIIGSIAFARSQKDIIDKIRSYDRPVQEHIEKLKNPNQEGGNDPKNREKWKKDIDKALDNMKKQAEKLKVQQTRQRELERIENIRNEVNEIPIFINQPDLDYNNDSEKDN